MHGAAKGSKEPKVPDTALLTTDRFGEVLYGAFANFILNSMI